MKYKKENIEKDYNLALSSFIYHRCLLRDSLAIVLIDSFVMSFSLIVSNAILFWINGITFSIVNGWLLIPGWIVYALLSKLLPGWGIGASDELRKIQRNFIRVLCECIDCFFYFAYESCFESYCISFHLFLCCHIFAFDEALDAESIGKAESMGCSHIDLWWCG